MSHDPTPQAPATTAGVLGLPTAAKRVDCFGRQGVFVWQKAIHVACDLPEPVRYSLGVLALYMDPDGTSGRPGFARFILARRKADKTVRRHIEQAVAAGWLICDLRGGRDGHGVTRASSYSGALPLPVFERLDDLLTPAWGRGPWSQEVTHERPVEIPSSGHLEGPVENEAQEPQPVISKPQPVISTASTGHPGRPTTDPSHRSPSPLSPRASVQPVDTPAEERETSSREQTLAKRLVLAAGVKPEETARCLTWITERYSPKSIAWWRRVEQNGDAQALVAEWRAATTASRTTAAPRCVQCNGAGSVTDDNDVTTWCPTCKPYGRPAIKPYQHGRQRSEEVRAGDVLARIAQRMEDHPR